jgi:hypothetical protein
MGSIHQDEDRDIKTFFETKDVRLDRAAIKPNSAKRGIAKLCLNSMWDKLSERNNRTKTRMISDPRELYRFLSTLGIEVANLLLQATPFWASWRYTDAENIPSLRHTNEVIGAFVTFGARLHLYSFLDCRKKPCTATPIVCSTYSVTTNRRGYHVVISLETW